MKSNVVPDPEMGRAVAQKLELSLMRWMWCRWGCVFLWVLQGKFSSSVEKKGSTTVLTGSAFHLVLRGSDFHDTMCGSVNFKQQITKQWRPTRTGLIFDVSGLLCENSTNQPTKKIPSDDVDYSVESSMQIPIPVRVYGLNA